MVVPTEEKPEMVELSCEEPDESSESSQNSMDVIGSSIAHAFY